jgi:hypothetical protein
MTPTFGCTKLSNLFCRNSPIRAQATSVLRFSHHTQLHTHTPGTNPLNKWSARRRGRYLHNKHTRRTSMPSEEIFFVNSLSCVLFLLFPYLFLFHYCPGLFPCLYSTTYNTNIVPQARVEPAIPSKKRPQTSAIENESGELCDFESSVKARVTPCESQSGDNTICRRFNQLATSSWQTLQ